MNARHIFTLAKVLLLAGWTIALLLLVFGPILADAIFQGMR